MIVRMPEAETAVPYEPSTTPWWREHLALVASAVAAATIFAKVWSVSHGDVDTIRAIVATRGLGGLLGAALLVGLPTLSYFPAFFAALQLNEAIREREELAGPIIALVLTLALTFAFAPAQVLALAGMGAVVMVGLAVISKYLAQALQHSTNRLSRVIVRALGRGNNPQHRSIALSVAATVVVTWLLVSFSGVPWLPPERIKTESSTIVGYVLSDGAQWTSVLTEYDRRVLLVRTEDIASRTPCRLNRRDDRSLMARAFWNKSIHLEQSSRCQVDRSSSSRDSRHKVLEGLRVWGCSGESTFTRSACRCARSGYDGVEPVDLAA